MSPHDPQGHSHDHGHDHGHDHPERPAPSPELSRRDFLRVSTTLAATATLTTAACQAPVEQIVPWSEGPEGLRGGGKKVFYATVVDGVPVLAWSREGRPILVTPAKAHPSRASLSVRSHASLLDLYDPGRAEQPLSVRRGKGEPVPSSWGALAPVVSKAFSANRGKIALLVRPQTGPATRAALTAFSDAVGARVVEYSPFDCSAEVAAFERCFGTKVMPTPRLDRAKLVVGLGAEHLDVPEGALERDFSSRRSPDVEGGMSRFVQFEGRMSLTGANADKRVRVRDSQLAIVAAALAHELVVKRGMGPLAGDPTTAATLSAFTVEVAERATGAPATFLTSLAAELAEAGRDAVVLTGQTALASKHGVLLATVVNLLNTTLGAIGSTLDVDATSTPPHGGLAALEALVTDIHTGQVKVLLVAGPNPVFDAPPSLRLTEALAKLDLFVSLNDRVDETSALADYLAPASHPFEAWGDAAFPGGILSIQQPLIRPLHATHGLLDILLAWSQGAGASIPGITEKTTNHGYDFVRARWAELLAQDPGTRTFEGAWDEVLRTGWMQGPKPAAVEYLFSADALNGLDAALTPPPALEVTFHPHFAHYDGRSANNGWLHELPDPLTRATWGDWVGLAPRRFDQLGLENGQRMTLEVNGQKVALPAYRHAGLHENVVSVPLGLGRSAVGKVGDGVGGNGFVMLSSDAGRLIRVGLEAKIDRTEGFEPLAITQGSEILDRKARPLFPVTTIAEYRKDPAAGTERSEHPSIWPKQEYDTQRWGMAIDLSKCSGCAKCTVACQSENNIPVVGKLGVTQGREMSWIRIDRYWDAGDQKKWGDEVWDGPLEVVEEPKALFEPMLCQHCENAPCETVCPFSATMHSEDGLNQQVYNRCVGTRYCANNCPFKVRRFNWHEYSTEKKSLLLRILVPQLEEHAELNVRGRLPMKNNPEVTVRSRGVMEKCSFCVQRIREARSEAKRNGHPGQLADGDVVPACMEACPSQAIVFGDLNDPSSQVRKLAESPRAMRLLESTNVGSSIRYLTKVRNDNG
ncbi:4Fe-4S dicluster domain-containing protein [Myxococcota bacterium]|nr:4Fe-4S dicluster domain-containing protein [Myxococcota bacterium]